MLAESSTKPSMGCINSSLGLDWGFGLTKDSRTTDFNYGWWYRTLFNQNECRRALDNYEHMQSLAIEWLISGW